MTRILRPLSALALLSTLAGGALGCAAPGAMLDATSDPDAGTRTDSGGPEQECFSNDDCETGFLCAAVEGVVMCVPDPDPPPPGDGTDCSPCPAPGECRAMVCVQPSTTGAFCEFDPECPGQLCIAGRCTPDPRVPTPCVDTGDCYAGLTCGPAMVCVCAFTADCPIGLICTDGACVPGPGGEACFADDECPPGAVCDLGRCRDGTVCDIEHPDLAGTWEMTSVLNVRESLPDWLDDFLMTVEEPLRFLAGDASCFDFGLPTIVEEEICDLVRPLIEEYIPAWVFPLARAIADLNDILSTWTIGETMVLEPGGVTDSYRGTHTWNTISFSYRGMPLMGASEAIRGWRFTPSPFNASAVCGTFHIERHDVNVSIAAIIAWLVDVLVYALTETEYDSLGAALAAAAGGFCGALADFADDVTDYDVRDTVMRVCTSTIASQIDAALLRLLEARVGADAITLRGSAEIRPSSLINGVWDGTLFGSGFTGSFLANR